MNTLIDSPHTSTDPTETLRPACLMGLDELVNAHAAYERRLHHDLVWGEDTFSDAELAHAIEVGLAYAEFQDAIRFTVTSHRF